jgi:hypothetical protein
MRLFLTSTALGALAAVLSAPAMAETVVSTALTSPLKTSVSGDIRISSTGSVKPAGGAAVTTDSNNAVKNEGTIAIKGANGATGILANTDLAGAITNSGTITIDEDYTAADSDKDGDLDGPFAQGSNRFGIRVLPGGTFTGNITNSGTITIQGNQSAGIALDSALAGSLTSTGKISILGSESVGIRAGAVSGSVTISNGSSTLAQGQNAVGVLLGGDIGGALVIQGSITSTGYRYMAAPADASKLDSDDLMQGGSAVVVSGSVGGGVLLDAKPADNSTTDTDEDDDGVPDAKETTATIASIGAAPAIAIGSATQDIAIGAVASSGLGHGLAIKGSVTGSGLYNGVSATGLSIGGTGHAVNIAGGMTVSGTIAAKATGASATAVHIGDGATVPQIVVTGTIGAVGGGSAGAASTAILIDSGATVNALFNSGAISASRTGELGTAAAIVDRSGKLALVQNNGAIGVGNAADLGDTGTAIDLRANTTGAIVRQIAASSGRPAPLISGNILFGSGNDTLDLQAGSIFGKVDFGGGTDIMSLTGGSAFHGTLANSGGLAVTVGTGATFDVQNLGIVNLASLTAAAGSSIGVTVGDGGNTLYNVAGTASFGAGSKVIVTLNHVGSAAGTYTIIDAGTLTGAENLTSSIVTLPFLFDSTLAANAATGQVSLGVELKDSGELALNRSEAKIIDAALDAADADRPLAAIFLSLGDSATLKNTLQQLMPEQSSGAFEMATKGSRLASGILTDPRPLSGLWVQQVAWGSSKSIGQTSSYKLGSWGATAGYDLPLGPLGSVGVTAGYFFGKDSNLNNELISDHYEGGVYWRGSAGPLRAWARATAGTIDFDSTRTFNAALAEAVVTRSTDAKWKGRIYSGSGGISYEARAGRLAIRPNASVDYYKLSEDGYAETGGGTAFDLVVRSRKSDETAASAMLTLGYDFMGIESDDGWLRFEAEGGRREILSGSLGDTIASFGNADPFTLTADQRTSGWRGGLRAIGGDSGMTFGAEINAEQQSGNVSLGGRLAIRLDL